MKKTQIQLSDHFTYQKLLRFVLPSIVMMVFTSIYGVVDGLFVSNFAGKTPFAAINLVMPFIMVLGGIGFMIGTGGTALVSKVLGEGEPEKAKRYFTMMILFTLLVGAVLTVFGVTMMEKVARFFGATDEMLHDCVLYGRIVISFTAAFMLQNVFQSFLVTAEKPKLGLIVTIILGVLNMTGDVLFMGVFHWGIAGAAMATAMGQIIGGTIPLVYFLRKNSSSLRLRRPKWDGGALRRACTNGVSELMSSISMSIVGMLYNAQLMRYAGENGVAAYGTIMYVDFIFLAIFIGYATGVAPVISYHYGAGNKKELNNLLKRSVVLIAAASLSMLLLSEVMAAPLAAIFVGYDAGLLDMTVHAYSIYAVSFLFCGFSIFSSAFFTALGDGLTSALIAFLRTLVFESASVIILPLLLGLNGIWGAIIVAECMSVTVSVIFLVAKRKRYQYF